MGDEDEAGPEVLPFSIPSLFLPETLRQAPQGKYMGEEMCTSVVSARTQKHSISCMPGVKGPNPPG